MSRRRSRALIVIGTALVFVTWPLWAGQLYYSPVTVNTGQVPSTQTDFPVLIDYTDARFKDIAHSGHVNSSSGFDIRPYSDSGLTTALTYELERYNASTGEVIMWVKRSSLADGNVTYLGYGDSTLTTDGSSSSTWEANFLGVYHLKDGTTLNVNSATGSNNGTNNGATATSGQVDGAANTASASTQYIDLGTGMNPTAVTYSAWINATTFPATSYNWIVGRDNAGSTSYSAMLLTVSNDKILYDVKATTDVSFTGSHALSTGTWYHVALTYDITGGLHGYVNGASDGSVSANGSLSTTAVSTFIGKDPNTSNTRYWNGKFDEVRVAQVARSADYIKTEYNNQSAPSTFATLGTEVPVATPTATYTPTPTATYTPTATATYTPTPTATATYTPTPSATYTPTPTPRGEWFQFMPR